MPPKAAAKPDDKKGGAAPPKKDEKLDKEAQEKRKATKLQGDCDRCVITYQCVFFSFCLNNVTYFSRSDYLHYLLSYV